MKKIISLLALSIFANISVTFSVTEDTDAADVWGNDEEVEQPKKTKHPPPRGKGGGKGTKRTKK